MRDRTSRNHGTYLQTRLEQLEIVQDKPLLTYGILGVLSGLEHNRTRALRTAISTNVDIGADYIPSCAKEILEVLPSGLVRKLTTRH
jgi:hypothetical protein